MKENKKNQIENESCESLATDDVPVQAGKATKIQYRSKPSVTHSNQKIHPRKKIPPLPKGKNIPDETPSSPVELD